MAEIGLIVACSMEGGIGYQGGIPWRLKGDLKRFKELTMGNAVIVGRKTYESLPAPLHGRKVIILTRDENYTVDATDVAVAHELTRAIDLAKGYGTEKIYIIGGAEIYDLAKDIVEFAEVTLSYKDADYDTYLYDSYFLKPNMWGLMSRELVFQEEATKIALSHMYMSLRKLQ